MTDRYAWDEGRRWCSRCQRPLPLDSFRPNESMPSGLHYWCRECVSSYSREWRKQNHDYVVAYNESRRVAPTQHVCANPTCGKTFMGRRDAKTCSRKCRSRLAYLKRH